MIQYENDKVVKLAGEKVTLTILDYGEVEEVVDALLLPDAKVGEGFEIPDYYQRNSGQHMRVDGVKAAEMGKMGKRWFEFLNSHGRPVSANPPAMEAILNHLCFLGVLEPGDYQVEIYW